MDWMVFDDEQSIGMHPSENTFWEMLSVTFIFEPITLKMSSVSCGTSNAEILAFDNRP